MVFITKKMENVMSMYDERIAELEALLESSDERYLESERRVGYEIKQRELLNSRYQTHTGILAGILHCVMDNCGLEKHHLDAAMDASTYTALEIRNVLSYHEAVPEDMLTREYTVAVTIPVTVSLTVEATDEDDAEEKAISELESNGIEYYHMDFDLCYDATYEIEEN
jgi:Asp-tRNA(Asn)/Glu-tRNA(Gln) amidotransferase A subunit family amidase